MRQIQSREESGFLRQMSILEKKEFAQYIKGRDSVARGASGGDLTSHLLRNSEAVSEHSSRSSPRS